jgi:hypothetical protein
MKKVICLLIFYYTFSLALFSQVSFSTGVSRLKEGTLSNPEFFSSSKDQLFLNNYFTAKVDYKKNRIGVFFETLYLNKSFEMNQYISTQSGSGSSGYFSTSTTNLYSKVSFSYFGLKGGIDFIFGNIIPSERFNNQFYISIFHQNDIRAQFSETDQVQYRKYSYNDNNPNTGPIYIEYPAEYNPLESIKFNKSYSQFGIEFRNRFYCSNFFLELSAGTSIFKDERSYILFRNNSIWQDGMFNINASLKFGYVL